MCVETNGTAEDQIRPQLSFCWHMLASSESMNACINIAEPSPKWPNIHSSSPKMVTVLLFAFSPPSLSLSLVLTHFHETKSDNKKKNSITLPRDYQIHWVRIEHVIADMNSNSCWLNVCDYRLCLSNWAHLSFHLTLTE